MFALLALIGCAAPQQQTAPVRYRFDARDTSTVDLSAYGQPNSTTITTTMALLTVTTRDSAGGRIADVVIDSIVRDDGGSLAQSRDYLPAEMTASGKGAVFHLYLAGGSVKSYTLSKPNSLEATAITGALAMIFPSLPPRARAGESWTDTTKSENGPTPGNAAAMKTQTTEVNTWTLVSDDTLTATMKADTRSETGTDMGAMNKSASGTRQVVFDKSRLVHDAILTLKTGGSMGDATMKGSGHATITRLP